MISHRLNRTMVLRISRVSVGNERNNVFLHDEPLVWHSLFDVVVLSPHSQKAGLLQNGHLRPGDQRNF